MRCCVGEGKNSKTASTLRRHWLTGGLAAQMATVASWKIVA